MPDNQLYQANPLEVTVELLGSLISDIFDGGLDVTLALDGHIVLDEKLSDVSVLPVTCSLEGYLVLEDRKSNWVKWSKIGNLDFTIDQSNIAGERPLDWKGYIGAILKLDKQLVAYGDNGVTILNPVQNTYGMQTIHTNGLVHRRAVTGTNTEHYFIDNTNRLYRLSAKGLEMLDYSEYLSVLTNPSMFLDQSLGLLYICDGIKGYVFNTRIPSFGEGPANITGIGFQNKVLYVTSVAAIQTPRFHVITDIYDLGTRKPKTIQSVEIGTDLTDELKMRIESRVLNKGRWLETPWKLVNPSGIAYIPCYGIEFKFHIRSHIREYLKIDYLKVIGTVHGFSMLEEPLQ